MKSVKSTGRIIGVLLVFQLAGLIFPFMMLRPIVAGPAGFLANAAGNSSQIKLAVFLLLANCAIAIGIAITAWPVFRRYSNALALWLLAASVIMFSLQAVDNVHIMSMLSLSQEYLKASGGDAVLFQTLSMVMVSTRRWAHYTELLVIDSWMLIFYSLLWRSALVPRALTGFGLITVLLLITGITLPLVLGLHSVTWMGLPVALSHITLAVWLMVRGFEAHPHVFPSESNRVELAGV